MRGDRPRYAWILCNLNKFTPHARGSTVGICSICSKSPVYPACAGIDRWTLSTGRLGDSLPRMRGDRPLVLRTSLLTLLFTPHARGSTLRVPDLQRGRRVYPACAGIDLEPDKQMKGELGLPRMRGDRPRPSPGPASHSPFTPHARGSTARYHYRQHPMGVYPACAGIDRCCA